MFRASDRIGSGRPGVTAATLLKPITNPTDQTRQYIESVVEYASLCGLDAAGLVIQALHETGDFKGPRWVNDLNPAGIAIVADSTQQPFRIQNGQQAAAFHVQAVYSMLHGGKYCEGVPALPGELMGWMERVWRPKVSSERFPLVKFWGDGGIRYTDVGGTPRAVWAWESEGDDTLYGQKLERRGKEFYPSLPEQGATTPATPPPAPSGDTPTTWQGWFDLMFGKGKWRITQDWANDPPGREYDDLYNYGAGHGLDGQKHPGIDVGLAYNTPMYAPAVATVVCAGTGVGTGAPKGGCGAYNDTGSAGPGGAKQGVGRIELYFPNKNTSLIFGHSRTAAVRPGQQVKMGDQIGGSGGMYGPHCHLEAVRWGTAQGYTYIDPRILLAELQQGGASPMPDERITFGRVPMYGFTDKRAGVADKPEGGGWDNLGQRKPKFRVLHRMLGSLDGTDGYPGDPSVQALTDFGLGVRDMDGASKAGWIYMWADPEGYRSGWASGPVRTPYGDGKKIVDKYGIVAVNRDGVSVEISGKEDTPIDDVAWRELVHLCSWWVDHMKIPYTSRVNPATGANYLIWHEEFTLGTGKKCPFDVVKALTNKLYNDISTYLQPYQTGGVTPLPEPGTTPAPVPGTTPAPEPIPEPQYAPPMPIPELVEFSDYEADAMKAIITTEGNTYVFVNDMVKAIRDTPRLQTGVEGALHIGPVIQSGQTFEVTWMFRSSDGRAFYVSPYWSRILVSDTERVSDAA